MVTFENERGFDQMVIPKNALSEMHSNSGNLRNALQVFDNMTHITVITWTAVISALKCITSCMIDLLGRAGHLAEALKLLHGGSLLAASNTHGDAELGELALLHLVQLEPWNSGNYAILSNTYASAGRMVKSVMARKMMKDRCSKGARSEFHSEGNYLAIDAKLVVLVSRHG
ncbi:hypothetical protein PVK06_025826 [Gossypium arboreum]|uniref:Pentatricopeptide repeat-containing protein n=1 Tax=Gossypium arboreum TaxID=29729 RepID=A0ABR0NW25_GOSAR|nr:hypothetical protein PVK06_025826 [Gossypium arboreum]